jgi:hypothetical protein
MNDFYIIAIIIGAGMASFIASIRWSHDLLLRAGLTLVALGLVITFIDLGRVVDKIESAFKDFGAITTETTFPSTANTEPDSGDPCDITSASFDPTDTSC